MLSAVLAQQIAAETSEAIGHNVIITDTEGIVIGSGDESRVGTFHEASLEVVRTQESAWHSPEQARALRGVRPGITLPLVRDGEAVGTVGITGSPRQVRRFGILVRRQTEILLEESALLRNRFLRERALEDLVGEVNLFDPDSTDLAVLIETARNLGFSLLAPRVAVLIEVDGVTVGPELLRAVRAAFQHPDDIVAVRSASRCQALLHADRSRSVADDAAHLVEVVRERLRLTIRVAIGEPAATLQELRSSCEDAADALSLGARLRPDENVASIADLRGQQALAALSPRACRRLTAGALGPLRRIPDWPALRATVVAWCESGFNLVAAAEALHIHRNTLVYRLEKIERLLEHPWRDHRAMLTVYLASLADQLQPPADTRDGLRVRR